MSSGASEGGEAGAINVMAHSGGAVDIAAGSRVWAVVSYQLRGGRSSKAGGAAALRAGSSNAGQGGSVRLASGGSASSTSGSLDIFSSDTSSGKSGSVTIGTGAGGASSSGSLSLGTGTSSAGSAGGIALGVGSGDALAGGSLSPAAGDASNAAGGEAASGGAGHIGGSLRLRGSASVSVVRVLGGAVRVTGDSASLSGMLLVYAVVLVSRPQWISFDCVGRWEHFGC